MKSIDKRISNKASIEGLPLQLLIMIVIAAVALAILLSWLNSVDKIPEIGKVVPYEEAEHKVVRSVIVEGIDYHNIEGYWAADPLVVKVYDKEENPLGGCTVTIQGCGVMGSDQTGGSADDIGIVRFSGLTISLPPGTQSGHITIFATKSGYGDAQSQLPVIRGESGEYNVYDG